MSPKKGSSELLNFRPGGLAAKIDGIAMRNGCSRSDVIRNAVEMYIGLDPLQPLGTYLGAAAYFDALAKAAADVGLISRGSYIGLVEALEPTVRQVEEKLEPLFRRIYPGSTTPREFHRWRCNETLRRQRAGEPDLTDEEIAGPEHIKRWDAAKFLWEEQFKDLKEARRMLLQPTRRDASDVIGKPPTAGEANNSHKQRQSWPVAFSKDRKGRKKINHPKESAQA